MSEFTLYDWNRDMEVSLFSSGGARLLCSRIPGTCYRFLMALGVWDVREGDYYRNGRWTWENKYSKTDPNFAASGKEFWGFVLGGVFS